MLDTLQNRVTRALHFSTETPLFSKLQRKAIRISIKEGEVALAGSLPFWFSGLFLCGKTQRLANKCLRRSAPT